MAGFTSNSFSPATGNNPRGVAIPQLQKVTAPKVSLTSGNNPRGVAIVAPPKPPASAPAPAPASTSTAGSSGGGSSVAPLDATALAQIASQMFKAQQSQLALTNQDTQALTDLNAPVVGTLAQLAKQQALSSLKLETGENARGGLYSSGYGQQLSNLQQAYGIKESQAQEKVNNLINNNAIKLGLLNFETGTNGQPGSIYTTAALGSAARNSTLASKAPLTAAPTSPSAKAAKKIAKSVTGGLSLAAKSTGRATAGRRR